LYSLAKSPGPVPLTYPILGSFLRMMFRFGIENDVKLTSKYYQIVVEERAVDLNLDLIYSVIHDRYGITIDMIKEFEDLCEAVKSIPVVVRSPVFCLLAADYE